jgi:aspartate carbamoyltransferase catalytic subunit
MDTEPRRHRSIISIDDLTDADVAGILRRARQLLTSPPERNGTPFAAGLLFLSSSLRTRVGFAAATIRLGGTPVDVAETRSGTEMSSAESLEDTVRTLGGMVDLLVTRTGGLLPAIASRLACPVINGGEGGGEHPTQALIDLLAIKEECGDLGALRIGLCGDLGARSVRSLVKLFERWPPKQLTLMAPAERSADARQMSDLLGTRITISEEADFASLDVLYMIGLPPGTGADRLTSSTRAEFALDARSIGTLPAGAVVLCPLPVIDEIAPEVRDDRRVRMFAQSDRGVAVRMACIEFCLDH